jgi:purine-binding chemotaxis protein CheW
VPGNVTITANARIEPVLPQQRQRLLLVFQLGDEIAAFQVESVERITPMAHLARPPGLPSIVEGFLNLAGTAVPVLRLDRLLQLPMQQPGLYSMLIILKGIGSTPIAMLVDRVSQMLSVPDGALLPVGKHDLFNGCAEAVVPVRDRTIHLLSPVRILLEKERESLSEFQAIAQRRLRDLELKTQ